MQVCLPVHFVPGGGSLRLFMQTSGSDQHHHLPDCHNDRDCGMEVRAIPECGALRLARDAVGQQEGCIWMLHMRSMASGFPHPVVPFESESCWCNMPCWNRAGKCEVVLVR